MIRLLDKQTADKIAAGEVVERPVSVVKELIENSIDAGASAIAVEIRKGGKEYIRITDDGCGIHREEVSLAFRRHATSKIVRASDLDSIDTLGFRGEALASIAAVSRVRMVTKTADESTGTLCVIEGSEEADVSQTGADTGTTIVVRDLFYNTPARRKFLKSDSAEANQIIELVSQMALCYPFIRFRMINGGNTLFTTPGKGDTLSAIYTIYGKTTGNCLVKAEKSENDMHIMAYVSNTGESRNSRKSQVFFVNGRVVKGKVMDSAVKLAYSERLFPGRFPIVFMFLYVNPETVDVNIHPNKKEVRFDDEKLVENFISEAIKEALRTEDAVPQIKYNAESVKTYKPKPAPVKENNTVPVVSVKEQPKQEQVNIKELLKTKREELKIRENPAPVVSAGPSKPFIFSELNILGTLFSTYIVGFREDAFYLIDQHAAHERVFYEKLMNEFESSEKHRQSLLIPSMFDIPASSEGTGWEEILNCMGFTVEPFGGRSYRMTEIPAFMKIGEAEEFVRDFVSEIEHDTDIKSRRILDLIASKACKAAVKGGRTLHESEIDALISELDRCENPYSCPHGRPTYVRFSRNQIERMFRRA